MKILQVHNYYQIGGGEDTVVAAEKAMLESNGHEVFTFYKHNKEIEDYSFSKKLNLLRNTTWSKTSYNEALQILKEVQPDVCHVHNFMPLISPSVYQACKDLGVPVVQTLHNYRLICSNGLFMRSGGICEDCLGKSAYGAVKKKCYRNSGIQTYAVARMIQKNKQVWKELVDAYICLTDFAKQKFLTHGLPENKLLVKPNFVEKRSLPKDEEKSPYFVYVGRLTESKGVSIFKRLANELPLPLKMVGEGELSETLQGIANVELMGKKSGPETLELIQNAEALILPSVWYEGMPMTILEAFSLNTPVIASNLGGMKSMIRHQENGFLFSPGSEEELLENLNFVCNESEKITKIVENAALEFDKKYSASANYTMLMDIYEKVIGAQNG